MRIKGRCFARGGHHRGEKRTRGLQTPVSDKSLAIKFEGAKRRIGIAFRADAHTRLSNSVGTDAGQAHACADRHALAVLNHTADLRLPEVADINDLRLAVEVELDALAKAVDRRIEILPLSVEQRIIHSGECGESFSDDRGNLLGAGRPKRLAGSTTVESGLRRWCRRAHIVSAITNGTFEC